MAWRTTFSSRVCGEPRLGDTRTHVGLPLPPRRGILRPAPGLRACLRGNRGRFDHAADTSAAMLRCDSLTPKDAGMLRGARSPMTLSSCHRWRRRSAPSRTVSGLSGRFSPMLSPSCGTCLSRPHQTKSRRLSGPGEVTSGRPTLPRSTRTRCVNQCALRSTHRGRDHCWSGGERLAPQMPSGRVFSVSVRRQLQINQFYMPKRINAETSTSAQNGGAARVTVWPSGDPP